MRLLDQWGDDMRVRKSLGVPYYKDPPKGPDPGQFAAGKDIYGGDRGYLRGRGGTSKPDDDPQEALFRHCQVEAAISECARRACEDVDPLVRDRYHERSKAQIRCLALWVYRDGNAANKFPDAVILLNEARMYGAGEDWLREFLRGQLDKVAVAVADMWARSEMPAEGSGQINGVPGT